MYSSRVLVGVLVGVFDGVLVAVGVMVGVLVGVSVGPLHLPSVPAVRIFPRSVSLRARLRVSTSSILPLK